MNIRFLKSNEKKKIRESLEKEFGISEIPYLLLETGKEKIRGFSGSLSKEEISKISQLASIEIIGIYILRKENDNLLRLGFDYSQLAGNQASKNIIELNSSQYEEWIRGRDLEVKCSRGIYLVKYKSDFLGCAKSSGNRLLNHVPKDRRLKK